MKEKEIVLKKVRVHNLKGVDLTLPKSRLIVFTGVSGSGKSSLAFDTIYVEGQRRYIESLSHHARRYLGDLPKPDAERIDGLSPTIAIEQKLIGRSPRSTVGTMTHIYDYLRVLFSRVAVPHCPISGEKVKAQSRETLIRRLEHYRKGAKLVFLAPYATKKGEFKEDFAELLKKGYTRVRIDGMIVDLNEVEPLDKNKSHTVEIVVDRIKTSEENLSRVKEATTQSLELGKGFFTVWDLDEDEEILYSQFAYAQKSGISYGPLHPHDFSFNHPSGMCPRCQGLGEVREFDLEKTIDPKLSIAEDCCSIASSYETVRYGNIYDNLARIFKFKVNTPWEKLSEKAKDIFLYGTEEKWTRMRFTHPVKGTRWREYVRWRGVLFEANKRLSEAKSERYAKKMHELMTLTLCPECKGSRIKSYPSAALLGEKTIKEVTSMTLDDVLKFFEQLKLSDEDLLIADDLLKEILKTLHALCNVGLQYLTFERTSPTLSGGEAQRVRLASQIGSALVGTIYVLDEPSIGLHPQDQHRLIGTLKQLRDQGNSIIVVEHDKETIQNADLIVDVGLLSGAQGGEIIGIGDVKAIEKNERSLTGAYLSKRLQIPTPKKRRKVEEGIKILGAEHHNLKGVDVTIPLKGLICITGVSGSGKSSLISDILHPALSNQLHHSQLSVGKHKAIHGMDKIDKVIAVDQSPIGRTPRSNPATYIKLFDEIRDLFTKLPESKMRGYQKGHFSFNVREGSCPYCNGMGCVRIDMDFMEDLWIECIQCKGKRFEPEILAVRYKEKNIYDILQMDVKSALVHFEALPSLRRKLELLDKVGLTYLQVGQPSTTLSGGEAQRIKLAKELVRPQSGNTLYILDEPTTGLHFHDMKKLIDVLQELVALGNTVLVIEHNMEFVKVADWIIDLGPQAGKFGGEIIGEGTVEQIAQKKTPTGLALHHELTEKGPLAASQRKEKQKFHDTVTIEGAYQNNLKDLSFSFPRNQITACTGPSGSGKSSFAFETLYAEGQRRYIESLPPYARQIVKLMPKPKVERIEGLSPCIALEQKTGGLNPRSTIGTITEVYDLLRVLYAHLGVAFCPETGEKIKTISKEFVVQKVLKLKKKEKIQILTPITFHKKEKFKDLCERYSRQGFLRVRLNGNYYELDDEIPFEAHRKNEVLLVIDRIMIDPSIEKRLFEGIEQAVQISDGIVIIAREKEDLFFNLAFAVESTGKSYPPITPQTFFFNSQEGMCLECQGLGNLFGIHFQMDTHFLRRKPINLLKQLFKEYSSYFVLDELEELFDAYGINLESTLHKLSLKELDFFLHGSEKPFMKNGVQYFWRGLETTLSELAKSSQSAIKSALRSYAHESTCPACNGERLNPLARNVKINDISITEFCALPIEKAYSFLEKLTLAKEQAFLSETLSQIDKSLHFLLSIGLGYLALNRSAPTLSGGELQRIRLAKQLGSGLTQCLYILDEPTIGLHPSNSEMLMESLRNLKALGNTLVLVEHDPAIIMKSDHVIDFGPKAGREGGGLIANAPLDSFLKDSHSSTAAFLTGKRHIPLPRKRKTIGKARIEVQNARIHNLKGLNVSIPLGVFTCITGVSGSGKSSLVHHILQPAMQSFLKKKTDPIMLDVGEVHGLKAFDQLNVIDQNPIGQTARADVNTYSDLSPSLRSHYASMALAKAKGLMPRHFSSNHIRGMCRTCWGLGYKNVSLQFLPPVRVECEACHGYRLNPISLEVTYKEKNLGQVLQLTVDEAKEFFSVIPKIVRKLDLLQSVGLGYLQLGQELQSLSGGEAQRLRLAAELSKRQKGKTLYLIDEPSTGLHFEDIEKLLPIFHRLVDKGHTLIVIEHNVDIMCHADHIIDLGPGPGEKGGKIVVEGTPEKVSKHKSSHTAPFLAKALANLHKDV